MIHGANARAALCFALLAVVGATVLLRLAWLQGLRADSNRAALARQRQREEALPAPRGTILDRGGRLLAYDRPVVEVRAEAYADLRQGHEAGDFADFARALAADLAFALDADAAAPAATTVASAAAAPALRALLDRIRACRADPAQDQQPRRRRRVDFLVAAAVDSAAVLERLDEVARRRPYLHLHRICRFERTYPERDATLGPVGFVGEVALDARRSRPVFRGMEAFAGLVPGAAGRREVWQDAAATRYWVGRGADPERPTLLQSTLDLALQKAAQGELEHAVSAAAQSYGSPPDWGALCLAEIDTGAVLAMASYRDGAHPRAAAFAPAQCLSPPGSVVKPLVFSLLLERGLVDWDGETVDCAPDEPAGWRVPGVRRWIKDSHPCGVLGPRDILVQSSNIGAARLGMRLGREGFDEYLRLYQFGAKTGTRLPEELAGVRPRSDDLLAMDDRAFYGYTAPSLSYGYEYNVTPLQILRAYVTLLSRRPRQLCLFARVVEDGAARDLPAPAATAPFLSEATLRRLIDAMRGVVSDEHEATGRHLAEELAAVGASGMVAGKTGTSEYEERRTEHGVRRRVMVRTASFAGFAPADNPRYVAVCVLQKPGASSFWGGRYAAPAAGRLLLRALGQPLVRAVDRHNGHAGTYQQQGGHD